MTFLGKGKVVVPENIKPKAPDSVATQATKPQIPVAKAKDNAQNDKYADKEMWAEKEHRDFRGRCIVYASTILQNAGIIFQKDTSEGRESYYKNLFEMADKLKEYSYKK